MKRFLTKACLMALGFCALARGADAPPAIQFAGKDIVGKDVTIPGDRPTIVAFVRIEQAQSTDALKAIQAAAGDPKLAQVVVILSGPNASANAKTISSTLPQSWQFVADIDFSASGKMSIHVWPTTLVIKTDGTQVAHLAGMPQTFASELQADLEFASGKLDEKALQQRLTAHEVITDSPAQAASRHIQVSQRLIEQGYFDQARNELNEGLKIAPQDPMLQLTLARVCVLLKQPAQAIEILDKLPSGSIPNWQVSLIRGRALIATEKWADAKAVLPDSLTLNPDPAEAHYLLGLCYQHDQDWQHAAAEFQSAFERTNTGKAAVVPASK
ncbi:MAG TPA: tetratricopeptide repeat protein [Tepidisphaeraceae bacterium]|nr:tetratricopeptide repeat protein [Tepidisphaeraceae bacterium]